MFTAVIGDMCIPMFADCWGEWAGWQRLLRLLTCSRVTAYGAVQLR